MDRLKMILNIRIEYRL